MSNPMVYAAGAMTPFYLTGEYELATKWRDYAKKSLIDVGIKLFDPTVNSTTHFQYPTNLNDGVIHQNYAYLHKCELVLVNLDRIEDSIGSVWELSVAWLEHKPVIAFGECERWNSRPHFGSLITVKLNTVEDACDYIKSMYNQDIS